MWALGREWLLRQGYCQRKQKTPIMLRHRDLHLLQTGSLLSTETRKQKMSHCHIVAVRRSNRSPLKQKPQAEPPPSPPKGKGAPSISPQGGEPELLETALYYALCIINYALNIMMIIIMNINHHHLLDDDKDNNSSINNN